MSAAARFRIDARATGILLCSAGLALLWFPSLLAAALGVELIAAAFWWWARSAEDAAEQVPRWGWVRRPATALWLAFAIHATFPIFERIHEPAAHAAGAIHAMGGEWAFASVGLFRFVEAAAVVWAGLELLAALPLARSFSDFPGPFLAARSWLPALLPSAGFVVLWRNDTHWIDVVEVRRAAVVLLMLTAVLAVLRAYARRVWTASLRWLVVADCALAAILIAGGIVPRQATLMLWLAVCGGHAFLLAGELRGAVPRRGSFLTRLWRIATWVALASLAWPTSVGHVPERLGRMSGLVLPGIALTIALAAWITVGRMVSVEERRQVIRPDPVLTLSHMVAIVVIILGPAALSVAWHAGFSPQWGASLAALAPVVFGGWAGIAVHQSRPRALMARLEFMSDVSRSGARKAFDLVVGIERRIVGALVRLTQSMASALHDLHTGDAQEYLLFLIGVGLFGVILPLLR